MSKFQYLQNNFTYGELGTKFHGRTDTEQYRGGVEQLENFFTQRQGGIFKRPGSQFVAGENNSQLDGITPGRAIPFVVSKTEAYVVLLNDRNNDAGLNPLSPPLVVLNQDGTRAEVDYSPAYDGWENTQGGVPDAMESWQYAQNGDVLVLAYGKGTIPPHYLTRIDENNFVLTCAVSRNGLATKAHNFFEIIQTSFTDENINPDIRFWFSAVAPGIVDINAVDGAGNPTNFFTNEMVVENTLNSALNTRTIENVGSYFKVTDGSTTGFGFVSSIALRFNGGYSPNSVNIDTINNLVNLPHTMLTGTKVFVTESSFSTLVLEPNFYGNFVYVRSLGAAQFALYFTRADAINDTNRINFNVANPVTLQVQEFQGARFQIQEAMPAGITSSGAAVASWQESEFSENKGFPTAVAFHEQRLYFGRDEKVFASIAGNIFHFMQDRLNQNFTPALIVNSFSQAGSNPPVATDPFVFTIASNEANKISWIASNKELQVGTLGTEYVVTGGDTIISRDSISVSAQSNHGSSPIQPARVDDSLVFVTRDNKSLRDFFFSEQVRAYITRNLTLLNDEIIKFKFGGTADDAYASLRFKAMAFQQSRNILWILTSANKLIAATLDKDAQIVAWHKHDISNNAEVLSIAAIPNPNGDFDNLWMIVRRTNGETTLEKMGDDFGHNLLLNNSSDIDDKPIYVDSAIFRRATQTINFNEVSVDTTANTINPFGVTVVRSGNDQFLTPGTRVRFTSAATLPSPFVIDTDYYVGWQNLSALVFTDTRQKALDYVPTGSFDFSAVNTSTDSANVGVNHIYQTGQKIRLTTSNTLPAPLTTGTDYYVIRFSDIRIQFAASLADAQAGTEITLTTQGVGTHTIDPPDNDIINITTTGSSGLNISQIIEQDAVWFVYNHLDEGESVSLLVDGFVEADKTPETFLDGAGFPSTIKFIKFAVDDPKTEVIAGIKYAATMRTLRIEAGGDFGTAQGLVKAIDRVAFRFKETYDGKFGYDLASLEPIDFRPAGLAPSAPLPLFTGDKRLEFTSDSELDGRLYFVADSVLPSNLVSMSIRGVTFD